MAAAREVSMDVIFTFKERRTVLSGVSGEVLLQQKFLCLGKGNVLVFFVLFVSLTTNLNESKMCLTIWQIKNKNSHQPPTSCCSSQTKTPALDTVFLLRKELTHQFFCCERP